MIYFIIAVCALLNFIFSYLKTGKFANPVNIIGLLWLFLLTLAVSSITGINRPSDPTVYLVVMAVASMGLGSFFAYPSKVMSDRIVLQNRSAINIIFFVFCIIPITVAVLSFLLIVISKGYTYYLYSTRIDGVDRAIAAGSTLNGTILAKLTRPVIYFYTFIAISILILKGEAKPLMKSAAALLSMSIVFTSRADSLVLIVAMIMLYLVSMGDKRLRTSSAFVKSKKWLVLFFIIIITLFVWISSSRAGSKTFYEQIMHYIVGYHTVGFTLFDLAYTDPNSFLNKLHGYGLVSVSSFGFIIQQIANLLNEEFIAPAIIFRSEVGNPVFVGYFLGGKDYELNAFYTFMAPVYVDFGVMGITTFAFLYGFFLMRSYLTFIRDRNIYSLSLVLFYMWTGYNALLQSAISTDYWWFILILLFVFNKIRIMPLKSSFTRS